MIGRKTGIGGRMAGGVTAAALILFAACHDVDMERSITVTPASAELAGPEAVLLTAALPDADGTEETKRTGTLMLPLEWSVNNPDIGRIASSGGHSAVYASSGRLGQNVVFVRDQSGREGLVAINQR